jgi:tetratricopeptide (TPR) repeat protein
MKAGKSAEALKDYEAALEYPENFGVGKPYAGDRSPMMYYHIGAAYEAAGNTAKAGEYYRKATADAGTGRRRPRRVNADAADLAFHKALALKKLGDEAHASEIAQALVASGQEMLTKGTAVDEFAKFGERTSKNVEQARAHYVMGLGYLGSGKKEQARAEFEQAVKLDVNQMWAAYQLSAIK